MFMVVVAPAALANGAGRFEISNADFRVEDDYWLVDARADLVLSDETIEALDSGVALTLQYQFSVTRQRRFWPDKSIAEPTRNIQLQYLSLSRRYVVKDLDTGDQTSYATLFSALRQIGRIRDFRLVETAAIENDARHIFALRVVLNREKLPGPLQILIFWQGDFSLESEWYRWTLK